MCIHGGYKTQTITQIGNIIGAYDANELSLGAVRVYLAALISVASREAAKRSGTKTHSRRGSLPRYSLLELHRTTGLPLSRVKKEVRALERLGLLCFGETEVAFEATERPTCSQGLLNLCGGRSAKRPIPLPRPLLRFLAKSSKGSLIKTALAYCVRGLSLSRTGDVSGKGSIKATTISRALNLSERSARSARAELLRIGFIKDDHSSTQRKLNRTGAYFTLDFSWKEPRSLDVREGGGSEGAIKSPVADGSSSSFRRVAVDNFPTSNSKFAPLPVKNAVVFAPPYKDRKTPNGSKNQKTQSASPLKPSGLCNAKSEKQKPRTREALPRPNIRNVQAEDLKSFGRVEELFHQAVKLRLIEPTEANAINFLGAAARASTLVASGRVGDSVRVFIGIIRKRLWSHITQNDEDRALAALRHYRKEDPNRFRMAA